MDEMRSQGKKVAMAHFRYINPLPKNTADVPGEASLEERMGCGCGICYGCTCHTTKGPRRICADGPVFSKEDIIW